MKKKRILVVEDEPRIGKLVCDNLEAEGYRVVLATDGPAGLNAIRAGGNDLILLDVMLPEMDGFAVCKRIRQEGDQTPILFVTARDLPPDRITGLMAGGDDYLIKPFHLEELLARVHALLRRAEWGESKPGGKISVGQGWVNLETLEARHADGSEDAISQKEHGILVLLVEANGAIVTRNAILDAVWGNEAEPTPRTVDNFIVRLRKRFEKDPTQPSYLLTVRGTGYRLKPAQD